MEIFQEDVSRFRVLPRRTSTRTRHRARRRGVPTLQALRLFNGTIYRWNRPCLRHLRGQAAPADREPRAARRADDRRRGGQRRLLARPGEALATDDRDIRKVLQFDQAKENFVSGIRHGINAEVYWPQVGQARVDELVVRKLLPMAAEGLRQWEADEAEIGRLLGIIEGRCLRAANGATWQVAEVARREQAGESRQDALRGMLAAT